jgi:hypothetical protein
MGVTVSRTRLGDWDAVWGSYSFGAVDKVTPDLSLKVKEIKVGTLGDVVLGMRIIALEGKIMIEAREIDATLMRKLLPWYSSGASAPLTPTLPADLYSYAALLTLHPTDIAAGTFDEDINILKAVPFFRPMERDGVADDKVLVTFGFFPNRAKAQASPPVLEWGFLGPVVA